MSIETRFESIISEDNYTYIEKLLNKRSSIHKAKHGSDNKELSNHSSYSSKHFVEFLLLPKTGMNDKTLYGWLKDL